jgi:sulfate transport system ATP-binding protein
MMSIQVRQVSKSFGSFQALQDIHLDIATGELVALLGPSGSGKTTLLRIIAGLESTDSGAILFGGDDFTYRTAGERNVGFVFQHYALFRHMTILENVAFGLRVRPRKLRPAKREIKERARELLKLVQLEGLEERYPSQLSGGQRQRVALARALAIEPQVLLLDEPFGALDAKVRQELRRWLRQLHEELNITTVFVTHDQEEALELADRVVVMNQGKIEQAGTPEEVYHSPANLFVYSFLGRVNQFRFPAPLGESGTGSETAKDTVLYIRPHEIKISRKSSEPTTLQAVVRHIFPLGSIVRLELKRIDTGDLFEAEMSIERYRTLNPAVGETVFADLGNKKAADKPQPARSYSQII